MKSGYWKPGAWKNVPIFVHWTILLWLPWYWLQSRSFMWAVLTLLAYTALLLAHELGHALAARSRRLRVHSIRLYVLHGQCEFEAPYHERDHVFIAWGGVLAQMCVLVVALAALFATRILMPEGEYVLAPLFYVFIDANLVIAAINLIPVAPLDGHLAWRILPPLWDRLRARVQGGTRSSGNVIDFNKRRAAAKKSKLAAAELIDKLKKK